MQPVDESISTALGNRYKLERELGSGGSATVYLAQDLRHRRPVAVKVLHRHLAQSLGPERFQREIETTANLRHPHILPLFDSGEVAGTLFYVMPLVSGESLRSLLNRSGRIAVADALPMIRDVAEALGHAHAQGIIHRDVKPDNILIENGRAVMADFGIARVASSGDERLTRTGMSLGTPSYMAPEQAEGEEYVGELSDQYSLACVVYEMLTGHPPFTGTNAMSIVVKHLQEVPAPLGDSGADIPPSVEAALARALSKNPTERFENVGAFVAALTSSAPPAFRPVRAVQRELCVSTLPIAAAGGDETIAAMAEELTDVVTTGLAMFPYLTVVRGETADAEYQLSGRVRKSGTTIRVSIQLVRRATKEQLWGEAYDRSIADGDTFAVIDDVADRIIAVIADPYGVLVRSFTNAVCDKPTETLTPYEAVLLYYHYHQRPAPDTHTRARDALERAVEREPRNADAWACLTYLYLDEERHAFNPQADALARALAAGRRAVDADPTNANAHHALAEAHYFRGDLGGFRASAERAISLNKRDGSTAAMLGNLLSASGSFEQGVALGRHAMACNPFHPGWYLFGVYFDHYRRGAFADALAAAERINMPGYFMAALVLAVAHAELGHVSEAERARQELLAIMPTIDRDGPIVIGAWLRYQPELYAAFVRSMARAGIGGG